MKKHDLNSNIKESLVIGYTRAWYQKVLMLFGCLITLGPIVGTALLFRPDTDSVFGRILILLGLLSFCGSWFMAGRMSYFIADESTSWKNAFLHAILPCILPVMGVFRSREPDSAESSDAEKNDIKKNVERSL